MSFFISDLRRIFFFHLSEFATPVLEIEFFVSNSFSNPSKMDFCRFEMNFSISDLWFFCSDYATKLNTYQIVDCF